MVVRNVHPKNAVGLGVLEVSHGHQLGHADVQGFGDGGQFHHRQVLCSTLNATQIGTFDSAVDRQGFLRDAALLADHANGLTESHKAWVASV